MARKYLLGHVLGVDDDAEFLYQRIINQTERVF